MALIAPDTREPLVPLELDGVSLSVSPTTGGIWFSEDALRAVIRAGEGEVAKLDTETKPTQPAPITTESVHVCPVDGSTLLKYHYQERYDVILEQCMECGGVWASHSELDKLVAIHPGAPETFKLRTTNYPLDQNGEYNDTPPPAIPPAGLSPEAAMVVAEANEQHLATMTRLNSFTQFLRAVDRRPILGNIV